MFCFVGTAGEIDTRPFLEQVLADGKKLAVPLCTGKGTMAAKETDVVFGVTVTGDGVFRRE